MTGYSRVQRVWNRLRTIDLDSAPTWPESVTVIESDGFGPLVIEIASARVFPDGSVNADGRWIESKRFGLVRPLIPTTDEKILDGDFGFIVGRQEFMLDVVSSVGPRAASLGRARPGLRVFTNSGPFALGAVFAACGLTAGGVLISGGSSRRVRAAVFARIPDAGKADPSVRQFAELFGAGELDTSGRVYLMSDATSGAQRGAPTTVDSRFTNESAGAVLLAVNQMTVEGLAQAVGTAEFVTLESQMLAPLSTFAHPLATVGVADHNVQTSLGRSRFTQRDTFEMDSALRDGTRLPQGVEVISRPDFTVVETTAENHRVFENGRWRAQDPDVLREKSIGPWLISVKNAIVAPNGAVLLEDGTLLSGPYFGTPNYEFVVDGWVTTEVSERAGLALTRSTRFGHWLLQIAPRVTALSRFDETMTIIAPEVKWDDSRLLEQCGTSFQRIMRVSPVINEHLVRVPELIVQTHLQPQSRSARSDPHSLNEFVTRFAPVKGSASARRVYFARDGESGERGGCANRDELAAIAEEFGFETAFPEKMSLDEQIDLVTSTTEMLGEQGSALTWSMFMPRGSRLVMVQNKPKFHRDRAQTYHNSVLAARGSTLHDIIAFRTGTSRDYEIEPATVRDALEALR